MDIEEAREIIEITSKERNAVDNYINSKHTQMNALASFNVLDYIEAAKKGWLLARDGEQKTAEAIGNDVLANIEEFSLVYSAMYKFMNQSKLPYRLFRGTSVKEATNLKAGGTYDKLISTTSDETVAVDFEDVYNPAFLRIKAGDDIPFLDVTEFVNKEYLNREEKEYILAPFAKVRSANLSSKYEGVKYYDIELEKPELRKFLEGEKENLANNIKANFKETVNLGKELYRLKSDYEWISSKRADTRNIEDLKAMYEDQSKIMEQISEISSKVRNFSDMIKKYIQGCCAEKEQEYLQAHEIVEKENKRIAEEKRKIEEEQTRKKGISDFENKSKKFDEDSKKVSQDIYSQYKSLKTEEMKYYNIAATLGIKFDLLVDNNAIEPNLAKIARNITEMKRKIDETKINEDSDITEVRKAFEIIVPYEESLVSSYRNEGELAEIVSEYGKEAMLVTRKGIDEKVQNILKNTKMQLLTLKRNEVENRKIGFFGKIRGLDKLKEVELEGIDLEMQLLKNTQVQTKSNYSIRDTLADMRIFSIKELGSQMTEEMQNLEDNIKEIFGINESSIDELIVRKLNAHPMVIEDINKRERTSDKINKITSKNNDLKVEISKAQYNSYKYANPISAYNLDNPRQRFARIIENTAQITELPAGQGDEIRAKEDAQIGDGWLVK